MNAIRTRRSLRHATLNVAETVAGATAGVAMGLVLLVGIAIGIFSDRPASAHTPDEPSPAARR